RELGDAPHRLEDRRLLARELEQIAVRRRDDDAAALFLFHRDGCAEEVVCLVPGRLRRREPERAHELRQEPELLEQLVVELAPALIVGERLVPVRRRVERVPADQHGTRGFLLPQPKQHVREPDERSRWAALGAGTSGAFAVTAIRAAPVCARGLNFFRSPFSRRVPSGNMTTTSPERTSSTAVRIASMSRSPRRTRKAPPAFRIGPRIGLKS